MIKREYPDIEFVETDTETIENSLIALWELMYEKMTGKKKKVYPASPERLYIAYTEIPGQPGGTVQRHVPPAGSKGNRHFPLPHFGAAAAKRHCAAGHADQL